MTKLLMLAALLTIGIAHVSHAQLGPNMSQQEFLNALDAQDTRFEMARRARELEKRMDDMEERQQRTERRGW